jgi:hypothetical protein
MPPLLNVQTALSAATAPLEQAVFALTKAVPTPPDKILTAARHARQWLRITNAALKDYIDGLGVHAQP